MYDCVILSNFHYACNPQNQVLYTMGGLENLIAARKYYAATIDLTGGKSTRALLGICLVRPLYFSQVTPVLIHFGLQGTK